MMPSRESGRACHEFSTVNLCGSWTLTHPNRKLHRSIPNNLVHNIRVAVARVSKNCLSKKKPDSIKARRGPSAQSALLMVQCQVYPTSNLGSKSVSVAQKRIHGLPSLAWNFGREVFHDGLAFGLRVWLKVKKSAARLLFLTWYGALRALVCGRIWVEPG